jgi:inward rectifier potassium channel
MADREIRRDLAGLALALAKALRRRRQPRARVRNISGRRIIADGLEHGFWLDFYHNAMTASWPAFFSATAGIFIALNLVFAAVYGLGTDPIANGRFGNFYDLFFFSVETSSTVGYGDMHPQTLYAHSVATVEGFVAVVLIALMTGLTFARFSRPRARLIFARNPVVAEHNGVPTLIFRLVNARNAFISEATAKLWMLTGTESREGRRFVGFKPLRLIKNENPVLALSWTLFHPIDHTSPLYGWSMDDLMASETNFVVSIAGFDETSAQTVHARETFASQDLRPGHEYVDIHSVDEAGVRHIDYAAIHDTRPISQESPLAPIESAPRPRLTLAESEDVAISNFSGAEDG